MIEEHAAPITQQALEQAKPESQPPHRRSSIGINRNFSIYWLGQSLSALGDGFAFVAMPLLVLEATGSVAQMGLVTATLGVSQILMGIFAGPIVDRVDRRKLMIGCDIGRLLLNALIPLGWWLAGPQIWLIYLVTAGGGVLGNLFGVASITAIPNLVDKDQIIDANSRIQATFGFAFFVGPALSGLVSHYLGGPVVAVGLNSLSFLASILALLLVRLRQNEQPKQEMAGSRIHELLVGVRYLFAQPVLRAVTLFYMFTNMLTFAGLDLFIYRIKHDLGQNDDVVGLVLGVSAIGGIVTALLVPTLRRRFGFGPSFLAAAMIQASALVVLGVAGSVLLILPTAIAFVLGDRIMGVNSMTLRQEITPDHLLGRVTAAFWTLINVLGPLGAAVTTWLAGIYGTSTILLLMGVGGLLATAVASTTPIRLRRTALAYRKD